MAASGDIDDAGDLIDLNNGICILSSRRPGTPARSSSPLTYEEQEHLLDVCPPKLEQKLSLSSEDKKRRDINSSIKNSLKQDTTNNIDNNPINDHNDSEGAAAGGIDDNNENNYNNNDILVTLGHDKVIPITKRIDVVSSDTIKRVKDITKNLEHLIDKNDGTINSDINNFDNNLNLNSNHNALRDCGENNAHDVFGGCMSRDTVDTGSNNDNNDNHHHDNHDIVIDNEKEKGKQENSNTCYSTSFSPASSCSHSLESFETQEINNAFNFLTELEQDYEDDDVDDGINESISSDGPLMQEDKKYSNIFRVENEGKILKGTKICSSNKNFYNTNSKIMLSRPVSSIDYDVLKSEDNINRNSSSKSNKLRFFKSHSLRGSIKNMKKYGYENYFDDDEDDDDYRQGQKTMVANGRLRRSLQVKYDRKSWSEGIKSQGSTFYRPNIVHEKSSSNIDIADNEVPSTSKCNSVTIRTESDDPRHVYVDDNCNDDLTETLSSSASSDVDWSWVEEVESSRLKSTFFENNNPLEKQEEQHQRGDDSYFANENPKICELQESHVELEEKRNDKGDAVADVDEEENQEAAAVVVEEVEISPTINSPVNNSNVTKRMRQPCNTASNSTDSIVMSAAGSIPTAKFSLPVPVGCPAGLSDQISTQNLNSNSQNHNNSNNTNNHNGNNNHNNGISWVRASMRRLRHLRLPETTQELRERELQIGGGAAGASAPSSSSSSSSSSALSSSIIEQQCSNRIIDNNGGRNSLPDIALIAPEILAAQTNGNAVNNHNNSGNNNSAIGVGSLRPSSAPTARVFGNTAATSPGRGRLTGGRSRGRNDDELINSRRNSSQSRITASPGSDTSCSSTSTSSNSTAPTSPNSTPNATPQHHNSTSPRRVCERQRGADREDERGEDEDEDENPLGRWPHALSPALACLGCTLGLFNISRFAILSIQFGANFIVQFILLSLILGIPLFTLQVCLGQRLAAGAVDMWRISPLFQGVGIALLTAQAFIGIYSIVGVSWMFVYFRDSFITKQDKYSWAEPFSLYREDTKPMHNGTPYKLQETVPDYFSGAVLQRRHLNEPDTGIVTLKFQVAFNLAVVWMIIFVSLSKGLRSYGKVVYVFTLVPVFGTLVLCAKLLGLTPTGSIHQLFPATVWSEFFLNGKSWMAASTEVFLTWGLFGAAAMQIAAHNKHKHLLQRDTSLVVVLTFVVLLLSAFLANTCVQILRYQGYIYTISSFESISKYTFMHLQNQPIHPGQITSPERFMNHASFLAGQRVIRHGVDLSTESGYQVLRLATELVPATLAILGSEQVSPFWAVLFYFILILFGIAQQLAIWHCVITGIMAINTKMMKLWETTITFFSCACGYILGLPMATEFGIYVVYYLDYTVGGAWWIMVLYLVQVGAVFAVRGRPHTGEAVVAELFPPTGRCLRHWAGPLLSFTWNVVLPVALMVLSIMIFKSSGFRDLYTYRKASREYWPVWARQLGAAIQLIPILMIPVVAIIQTCRYLNSGPPDIFDRIQLLYRPSLEPDDSTDNQTQVGNDTATSIHGNGTLPSTTEAPFEDPPPKYTPPPSYTTATGARIAKMLRQSFRRSVRRIANVLGESSSSNALRQRPALQPPPPDYATVLVEMNQGIPSSRDISIIVTEAGPDVTDLVNLERRRPNTIDRTMRISTIDRRINSNERSHSTMDRNRRTNNNSTGSSNLTAADVANLLRSSIRRGGGGGAGNSRNQQNYQSNSLNRHFSSSNEPTAAVSIENLVEGVAPIGEDSLVLPKNQSLVFEQDDDDSNEYKKTVDQTENTTTVI